MSNAGPWQNWAGNVVFGAHGLVEPGTVAELQDVVRAASRVRALGTGHSFSRVADTDGLLVSTRRLDLPVEVLPDERVAVVPGGATFAEVTPVLHAQGWALANLGSLPHISVAGACATGTHGSGNDLGSLPTSVVGIELVTASGELVQVRAGDPDFPGAVLALGALGVTTRLWLRLEPTYDVRQDVWTDLPADAVAEEALPVLGSGYSVSVFSDLVGPDVVQSVWVKRRLDRTTTLAPLLAGREPAVTAQHPVPGHDAAAASAQLGAPGPWHERLPHFRAEFVPSVGEEIQSEYFLPRACAPDLLRAISGAASELAPALLVFEMRTLAADDLWLSPARGRDSVLAHFTWHPDWTLTRPALALVERLLEPWDPRPHWGKAFLGFERDRLAAIYPDAARFQDLRRRLDPDDTFGNAFLDRHLGPTGQSAAAVPRKQ